VASLKPLFIVFEGLDGSGTSTQTRLLAEYLRGRGERAHMTSEPSDGPIGKMIRTALSGRLRFTSDDDLFDRQLAYLFAADRHDHLWNDVDGVMKLLARGEHVISTRYYFSSYAYHCKDENDLSFVRSLNGAFPPPDAVIFIDVPLETSSSRLAERAYLDRYESPEKLEVVRRIYERCFESYDGPLLRVNGLETPDEVHGRIAAFLAERFGWS
jgi:dTMP kinase